VAQTVEFTGVSGPLREPEYFAKASVNVALATVCWRYFGENPFGHSWRRIADCYAGLVGDFRSTQKWKRLRRTKHDHHPVHDALGNAEALIRLFDGER
jgi:hypothetical protein